MLKLSYDKWLDFKEEFLEGQDYEKSVEDLFYFDDKSHREVENGKREIYMLEKNGNEIKLQVDVCPKMERHEGVSHSGAMKVSYDAVDGEFTYKVCVFLKDKSGTWRDSSAFFSSQGDED